MNRISYLKRFSYASSDIGGQLVFCVISFYSLYFYTDVYGISAAAAPPTLASEAGNEHSVKHDEHRESRVQSDRPGQRPAQLAVLGIDVSDGCHGFPSAG